MLFLGMDDCAALSPMVDDRSDFRIAGVKIIAGTPRPIKITAATSSVRKPADCFAVAGDRFCAARRVGIPALPASLPYRFTIETRTPCFTSHSPRSCRYGCHRG